MPIWDKIFGVVKIPLVDQLGDIVDEFHHSGEEKDANKLAVAQLEQSGVLAQLKVQATMLSHRSTFVAGGRPALIWMCVIGIGMQAFGGPTLTWITHLIDPDILAYPILDIADLVVLVTGALGLGALRSQDKKHGVTDK